MVKIEERIRVRATFIEGVLGTAPSNPEIYRDYVGSKAPDAATIEEEVEAVGVDEIVDKGTTVFPRLPDGTPFVYDYQIRGAFKDACGMLNKLTGRDSVTGKKLKAANESSKLTAYKKIIDGLIFVSPRKIPFKYDGEITICQRPLRAQTAQGERIALSSSEEIHAGAQIEFEVQCMSADQAAAVREWLDYGIFRGFGQWRNSGKGKYYWEELDAEGNVVGGNKAFAEEMLGIA